MHPSTEGVQREQKHYLNHLIVFIPGGGAEGTKGGSGPLYGGNEGEGIIGIRYESREPGEETL